MKNIVASLVFISILFAFGTMFTSCSFSGRLSKRYKRILTVTDSTEFIKARVSVSAYTIESKKKQTVPKTVFDLSPKGQAALISVLSEKDTSSTKFLEALQQPLSSKKKNVPQILDYSKFEKRIIISVRNNGIMPADRITKINISLDFGDKAKILSCNNLVTDYRDIDLAKLNYSTSQSAELNGNTSISDTSESTDLSKADSDISNNTTSNSGYGVNAKLTANRSFSEEVLLKQRVVALNAAIYDNKLSLYQDGISGIDLTGNIIADVIFGVEDTKVEKVYSFSDLSKKGVANNPKDIRVNEKLLILPNLTTDISASITFEAHYREVHKNHETITESDDKIRIYYGEVSNDSEEIIIPRKLMYPKLWKLSFSDLQVKLPIQIKAPAAIGPGDLIFNSFEEAENFALWLKSKFANTRSITAGQLGYIISVPQGFTDIQKLQILPYQ